MKVDEGTWRSFEQWQSDLKSACGKSGLLFRGQCSSDWALETTLEGHGRKSMPVIAAQHPFRGAVNNSLVGIVYDKSWALL